jgi:histidyl-tRNA synthetase
MKSKKISPQEIQKKAVISGFDYFYPEDQRMAVFIESKFREIAKLFNFEEIEGPLLQPIEFYEVKSGQELLENTYKFKDADENILVLRPELTPTVSYMIAKDSMKLSFPVRWWSNPILFRKERAQKGRKRQFKQLNMDIFDRADSKRERVFDEAEIIAIACFIFQSFKLTPKDIVIKISSRSLLERFFDSLEIDSKKRQELGKLLDKYGKIEKKEFENKAREILEDKNSIENFQLWLKIKSLSDIKNSKSLSFLIKTEEYKELSKLFELLESYQIKDFCEFDPLIVRGLGYYTGTVFEAFEKNSKSGLKRAILGGGRYDNLTEEMGGKIKITGVGFGFGNTPFEEMLKARNITPPQENLDYYICCQTKEMVKEAIRIASTLRKNGKAVLVDPSLAKETPDAISKQLSRASFSKAQYSIIVFPKEWEERKIIVKDMQNQSQKEIKIEEIL